MTTPTAPGRLVTLRFPISWMAGLYTSLHVASDPDTNAERFVFPDGSAIPQEMIDKLTDVDLAELKSGAQVSTPQPGLEVKQNLKTPIYFYSPNGTLVKQD